MAIATVSTQAMGTAMRWWARDKDNGQGGKGNSNSLRDGR
jgi:hypothetical protein